MKRTCSSASRITSAIEALVSRDDFIATGQPTPGGAQFRRPGSAGLLDLPGECVLGTARARPSGHTFYVWFDALLGYLSALLDDGAMSISID